MAKEKTKAKKPKLFKTVEELNSALIKAIKVLNSQKEKVTVSKLNRYFDQNLIPRKARSGELISTPHLGQLVKQNLLKSKKEKISGKEILYYEIIKQEKPREKQKSVEETEPIEEENSNAELKAKKESVLPKLIPKVDAENALIKCTTCSYYCSVEWDSCPNCDTFLTEEIKSNNVVLDPLVEELPSDQEQNIPIQEVEDKPEKPQKKESKVSKSDFEPSPELIQFKKLYEQQTRYKRNYLILSVLTIQYVLSCLFVAEFILITYIATEIQIDLWDYFLPVAFFMPPILYYQIKFYRVRKKRLLRDKHYSILLKFKRTHLSKEIKPISAEKERAYRTQFGIYRETIRELVGKVRKISDRKRYYFVVIGVLVGASVVSLFFNYVMFLVLLIIALCFVYPLILRTKVRYLTDAFMLGLEYPIEEYVFYLHYALRQVYYYYSQSEKEKV